ncbi:MAG: glycosyltransferase family 8 protein [Oscillospiraceae bacterium]|nr:glycosyltransferase family 8 protein [Oscillospiraceae bacterium]
MNKIPIVMGFEENNAMPACVAAYSALQTKASSTQYTFYFLVKSKMSENNIEKFNELTELYPETQIEYIVISENYNKLQIADIIPGLDKCLYLDFDIIVCDDLTDLWDIEIGNNFIAGVKDIEISKKRYKTLGLPTSDQYIETGVLLMNLKLIREEKLVAQYLELFTKRKKTTEQDILNKVCYNRVKLLPLKYNMVYSVITRKKLLDAYFPPFDIEDALKNPTIVQYKGKEKPWKIHSDFAILLFLWYQAAYESPYNHDHNKHMLKWRYDDTLIQQVEDGRDTTAYKIGSVVTYIPRSIMKLWKK